MRRREECRPRRSGAAPGFARLERRELLGSAVAFTAGAQAPSVHEVLVTFFLFLTAPVSAHLLAKAALHAKVPNVSGAPSGDEPRPPSA